MTQLAVKKRILRSLRSVYPNGICYLPKEAFDDFFTKDNFDQFCNKYKIKYEFTGQVNGFTMRLG